MSVNEHPITRWLQQTNGFLFSLYATFSAFCLYTCVYAFRKTFSTATFDGISYAGVTYKSWLVIFQVVGYALSKFIGIKVISELKAHSRSLGILIMVSIAGISWLLFAIVPPPYNVIFLFTNGLPLGMVWGMVFGYLEGRRFTEVLGAGLSVSFIFSAVQGGKMTSGEAEVFEKDPLFEISIRMRHWDELAKEINIPVIDMDLLKARVRGVLMKSLDR